MMMVELLLLMTSDDDANADTLEASDVTRAWGAAVVIARVSCSIRASRDDGDGDDDDDDEDDDDDGASGVVSTIARAALIAIALPSIPNTRANDSMKTLRRRSFWMLAWSWASDDDGDDDDDDGDDDDGGG
jgi:hypothetical protein